MPLTLTAGAGHWLTGSVDLGLLGSLLVGSSPGIIVASCVTARIPERLLRRILATTLPPGGSHAGVPSLRPARPWNVARESDPLNAAGSDASDPNSLIDTRIAARSYLLKAKKQLSRPSGFRAKDDEAHIGT